VEEEVNRNSGKSKEMKRDLELSVPLRQIKKGLLGKL